MDFIGIRFDAIEMYRFLLGSIYFYWNSIGFYLNVLVVSGKYLFLIGILLDAIEMYWLLLESICFLLDLYLRRRCPSGPRAAGSLKSWKSIHFEKIFIKKLDTTYFGFYWNSIGFYENVFVCIGKYLFLLEFYWILLKCIGFDWKVLVFYWNDIVSLLKCIGFYWKV